MSARSRDLLCAAAVLAVAFTPTAAPAAASAVVAALATHAALGHPSVQGMGVVIASDHFRSLVVAPAEAVGCDAKGFDCRAAVDVRLPGDTTVYPGVVLRCGLPTYEDDMAIVAVPRGDLPVVALANDVRIGTHVTAVGGRARGDVSATYDSGASFAQPAGVTGLLLDDDSNLIGIAPAAATRSAGPLLLAGALQQWGVPFVHAPSPQSAASEEYGLARRVLTGDGVPADPARALGLLRLAAADGSAPARRALGQYLARGTGVIGALNEAEMWLRLAAAGGEPDAAREADAAAHVPFDRSASPPPGLRSGLYTCGNQVATRYYRAGDEELRARAAAGDALAVIYALGQTNGAARISALRRAADLGSAHAMLLLSYACYNGEDGVTKSPDEANSWLRRAADAGSVDALVQLGTAELFRNRNAAAIELFERAAMLGTTPGDSGAYPTYAMYLADLAARDSPPNERRAAYWYRVAGVRGSSDGYARWRNLQTPSMPAR